MWEKAQTILKLLFNIHMEILDKLIGTIRKQQFATKDGLEKLGKKLGKVIDDKIAFTAI